MPVVVVGAGIAGLAASLAFARRGHQVTLLERDRTAPPDDPALAFDTWARPGVGHFRQPHLFLALGRKVLRDAFPDLLAGLIAAGAVEVDFRARVPGGAEPEDDDLVGLTCRRPFVETVLRTAAVREAGIEIRPDLRVEALIADGAKPPADGAKPPRVTGVGTQHGDRIPADLVVDASGRGTRSAHWLAGIGAHPMREESEDCGLMYNCRYFRFRDGQALPTAQSLFGPRGDLGYMGFATFPGEAGTWALALSPGAHDTELRMVRQEPAFMAAARSIGPIAPLVSPEVSEPTTPVMPMGELRNVLRSVVLDGQPVVLGFQPIGDALAHTDPSWGWGLSIALAQAVELATLADAARGDLRSLALAFEASAGTRAAGWVRASMAGDRARLRLWRGEAGDPTRPDADFPLFLQAVLFPASAVDREIFRATNRRQQLLDPAEVLPADRPLLERAAALMAERRKTAPAPPRPGPPRDDLLQLMGEAMTRSGAAPG
ncbi:MAG TPA: FAD-dependent oxidoreductase [Candidatus Saccharimonadales bacterium]|nr:FAD-dependent oxidoreductase [Candidatus Saccharimonadales bacterium]